MTVFGMTKRQHETLAYIEAYQTEYGYSPSFDEMRQHLGLRSKSGVHKLVHSLVERGHIRFIPDRARSIALNLDSEMVMGLGR